MNDGILAKKIKRKSLLNFLLSLPFLAAGVLIILFLSGSGLFSMDGYLKPDDVYSLNKINDVLESPFGYSAYTISLTATVDDAVDTGVEYLYDDTIVGNYIAAYVDGKYILCFISKSSYDAWPVGEGYTFTGTLEKADPEVVSMVISEMAKDNIGESEARGMLYGYMIDTRKTGFVNRTIEYLLILAIWFLGIFFFIRGLRPLINIDVHPAVKKLAKYGSTEFILDEIEHQLAASGEINAYTLGRKSKKVYLLNRWIIIEGLFNIKFLKVEDLLWAYKMKQTIKHYGIITTGVNYFAKLNCKGSIMSLQGDEFSINRLLGAISEKYPSVIVGFNDALETIWNSDIEQFFTKANAMRAQGGSVDPVSADDGSASANIKDGNDLSIPS